VIIAIYLLAPKTALTFYLFAAALGFTWLATVPPTAGLVGKLFGTRYLATLFGLTLLSHQVGGFFGAWLGGLSFVRFGDYSGCGTPTSCWRWPPRWSTCRSARRRWCAPRMTAKA
jgi:MFS family permease